jgi:hypothetical protein
MNIQEMQERLTRLQKVMQNIENVNDWKVSYKNNLENIISPEQGVVKMPNIKLAYKNPNLKIGDKVEMMSTIEHTLLGTYPKTSAWGPTAEQRFCNKQYTITADIIKRFQNRESIPIDWFPEFKDNYQGWTMSYADFKMATVIEIVETPVFQILKLKGEEVSNILLTPNETQANEVFNNLQSNNTDPAIHFAKINFTIKKRMEKEL